MAELNTLTAIQIARGETVEIKITATGGVLTPTDKFAFSVRKDTCDTQPYIIYQEIGFDEDTFTLTSEQTRAIPQGTYYYDVWLVEDNGRKTQLCLPTIFEVVCAIYKGVDNG